MIRLQIGVRRRQYLTETLDTGDPSPLVREVLAVPDSKLLIPVGHAAATAEWMGRCHAYFGLGYPTTLVEMRTRIVSLLNELENHPAMWGHGMLGQPRSVPISCWDIPGARYPDRLFSLHPGGREGFLVPTKERIGVSRGTVTAWTFEPSPHGGPRPESTMFRSTFGTRREVRHDAAAEAAARQKVRAAVLGVAGEADPDQGSLVED